MSDVLIGCGLVWLGYKIVFSVPEPWMNMIEHPIQERFYIIVFSLGALIAIFGVGLVFNSWSLPFTIIQFAPVGTWEAQHPRLGN
jgi:hypothetical protein